MALGVGLVFDVAAGAALRAADRSGLDPGPRRLIAALAADPRFALSFVAGVPGAAPRGPVACAMAGEARVFPAPDRAPAALPAPDPLPAQLPAGCAVVVDLSASGAARALAGSAPQGRWRLSAYAPGAGWGAARDRAPVTAVTLWRDRAGAPPEPLAQALYDTKFLASRNRALIREKSVQLVLRALADLAEGGLRGEAPAGPAQPTRPAQPTGPAQPAAPHGPPRPFTAADLPGYALSTAGALARRGLLRLGERLGQRPGMFELRLGRGDGLSFDPAACTPLTAPPGRYWADPFLFERDGALYLFYEVYDYASRRGHIDVGRVEGDALVPLGTALALPYHLSFPHVFAWDGAVWMVPETHATKRLELWRARDFPTGWERVTVQFEGTEMSDTVLFEQAGQWWMFSNICHDSFGDFAADLYLFRISSPLMEHITPHPLNPVVIDTTCARGGGRVFAAGGKLYRTSQDNSHGLYGYGLNLMEITRLDMAGYGETRVRHVAGGFAPGLAGCHHMDAAGSRVVIDTRRQFWRGRRG